MDGKTLFMKRFVGQAHSLSVFGKLTPSGLILALILAFLLSACSLLPSPTPTVTPAPPTVPPSPTPTLADISVETTAVPDPLPVAQAYLDAWKVENYPTMYAQLTTVSKGAILEADFTRIYTETVADAALTGWDTEILASLVKSPYHAEISYRVTLHSNLVGDVSRETAMNLALEQGQWRVQWDYTLILPELKGGNILKMETNAPARASIYDRNGNILVGHTTAVAIGLDSSVLVEDEEKNLYGALQRATGIPALAISEKVNAVRQWGWYVPVADMAADQLEPFMGSLSGFTGIYFTPFESRYYYHEGIAPHVVGYMSAIQPGEVEYYKRLGYAWNERVGRMGLEIWGEQYLGGTRGGKLYVISPEGAVVTLLAERAVQPSQAIYTTIDKDLQQAAQVALNGFYGAVVVMERNTGRVLAMASSPGFNPNLFEPTNYNSGPGLQELKPSFELNRATQGQYPLGSVFKIVTMSAALQSGAFTSESSYNCTYQFTELPGVALDDWTWQHYQEDGVTQASGELTLPEGLMRSCNPWFYHIGLTLFNAGYITTVSDMAKGFGLGGNTGIQIIENPGNIPVPAGALDATNNAIGQGNTAVNPLQVANFVAAVGNGGVLYQPSVVEKIVQANGSPTYVFTSTVRGQLPVSFGTLQIVQDAMKMVVDQPRGTAYKTVGVPLKSYGIPIAGKTGTAQSGDPRYPHAWFAGYTYANRPDRPDIAVAVVLEYEGEGSVWAAPIFTGMVYSYFYPGSSRAPFPWEVQVGVRKSPTPIVTDTPTPTPEVTETPVP